MGSKNNLFPRRVFVEVKRSRANRIPTEILAEFLRCFFAPDLAEKWDVSDDGLVWTFYLRKGVQFHKKFGELTAEDVKYSFERQINREKGMRFAKNLGMIKEIKILDPHKLE
ncbi:hypothetical protein C2W62_35315, partial [Candidatus Entotheonella serta]